MLEITLVNEWDVLGIENKLNKYLEQKLIRDLSRFAGITRSEDRWLSCNRSPCHKNHSANTSSLTTSIANESRFMMATEISQIDIPQNKRQIKQACYYCHRHFMIVGLQCVVYKQFRFTPALGMQWKDSF